nr:hypothetical protein [Mycobacterium pseudoshottsii]
MAARRPSNWPTKHSARLGGPEHHALAGVPDRSVRRRGLAAAASIGSSTTLMHIPAIPVS